MKTSVSVAVFACALAAVGLAGEPANAQQAAAPAPAAPPFVGKPVPGTGQAYRIYADTVANGEKPGVQGVPCVNQSIFPVGDLVVWRAVISDGPTGVELTAADVAQRGLQAAVTLADGTKIPVRLSVHPPFPSPVHETYWSGSLFIRPDHPTGTLPWTLTVSDNQGRTGTFTPAGQASGNAVLTLVAKAPAPAK